MSRPKATVGEMLGAAGAELKGSRATIDDLPRLLGNDDIPDIPFNEMGRVRLIRALQKRFGSGFRSMQIANDIIRDFDEELQTRRAIGGIRG